jgi:hypothetical protein
MKIWTEEDMEPVIKMLDDEIMHPYRSGARTRLLMIDIYHAIAGSWHESDDQTIYGFKVRDLVPLASVLRAKGVSPKEIEDWHKDLQGLLDFVAEQEMEAHQKAVADVLKGFKGPDEETGEWFVKAIGSKGEEGEG